MAGVRNPDADGGVFHGQRLVDLTIGIAALVTLIGVLLTLDAIRIQFAFTVETTGAFRYGRLDTVIREGLFGLPRVLVALAVVLAGVYFLGLVAWAITKASTPVDLVRAIALETTLFSVIILVFLLHGGIQFFMFLMGVPLVLLLTWFAYAGLLVPNAPIRIVVLSVGMFTAVAAGNFAWLHLTNSYLVLMLVIAGTLIAVNVAVLATGTLGTRFAAGTVVAGLVWSVLVVVAYAITATPGPVVLTALAVIAVAGTTSLAYRHPTVFRLAFPGVVGGWGVAVMVTLGRDGLLWTAAAAAGPMLLEFVAVGSAAGLLPGAIVFVPLAQAVASSGFTLAAAFLVVTTSGVIVQYTVFVNGNPAYLAARRLVTHIPRFETYADHRYTEWIAGNLAQPHALDPPADQTTPRVERQNRSPSDD